MFAEVFPFPSHTQTLPSSISPSLRINHEKGELKDSAYLFWKRAQPGKACVLRDAYMNHFSLKNDLSCLPACTVNSVSALKCQFSSLTPRTDLISGGAISKSWSRPAPKKPFQPHQKSIWTTLENDLVLRCVSAFIERIIFFFTQSGRALFL